MHFLRASQSESYEVFLSPIWWENSGFESLLHCCLKAIERRLLNSPIPGSGQVPSLLCASALKWPELKGRRGTGQWPAREDLGQSGHSTRAPGKSTSRPGVKTDGGALLWLHKVMCPQTAVSTADFQKANPLGRAFQVGQWVKNPPTNAEDAGSIPGSGRPPEEGNGTPRQYSCMKNPRDREPGETSICGVARSWTPPGARARRPLSPPRPGLALPPFQRASRGSSCSLVPAGLPVTGSEGTAPRLMPTSGAAKHSKS